MAAAVAFTHLLLFFVLVFPAACSSASPSYRCDWCPRRSTASLLPPDAGALDGAACGYGDPAAAAELADGGFHIAAVSAGFFRRGRACGACYQLSCRGQSACAEDGVEVVVVADVPETNSTGRGGRFMLNKDAFAALTTAGGGGQLASLVDAAVDVDFRRIPCAYKGKNMAVRVEETSGRDKGHLAVRFLYQGGQTDIVAVEVAQAEIPGATQGAAASSPTTWQYMTRSEGSPGLWRTSRAPAGPLRVRLVVTAGSGGKWLRTEGVVLRGVAGRRGLRHWAARRRRRCKHLRRRLLLRLRRRRRRGVGAQMTSTRSHPSRIVVTDGPSEPAYTPPAGRGKVDAGAEKMYTRGGVERNAESGIAAKKTLKEGKRPPHRRLFFTIVAADSDSTMTGGR